jgi:predicted dehydrogenase
VDKIKIGIIGCGQIADEKHLPGLTSLDNVECIAFCDTKQEIAQTLLSKYGTCDAKLYSDADRLFENKDIDVVHICTTSKSHAPLSIKAMEAGKHVMCEKPIASTLEEARTMIETAKRTKRKLTIGCQSRFRKDAKYLKQICERGDLGEIYYARALALRRRAVPTWLLVNKDEQGGGPLWDIGTHALDLTFWLMENFNPASVTGKVFHKLNKKENEPNIWKAWNPEKFVVEDSAFGFISMKNGAIVSLESSWALNILDEGEARTMLCGTNGGADMQDGLRINGTEFGIPYYKKPDFQKKLHQGLNVVDFTFRGHYEDSGLEEAKSWIDCIIQDTEPVVKPEQALVVAEVLGAVQESSKIGRPITFG